ncbi:MAG: circadian clock protein KaiC [Planctomycetes bacterium]|nr:circadian clock protein KaiC [Planctomycetota bacterium]
MNTEKRPAGIEKLPTGIPGFDHIAFGGLPKGRTTLVSGTAGSGKTVLACQFLAEGITGSNQNGVMVTFEESPADIRTNMLGFGWDIQKWEDEGKWAFVDGTRELGEEEILTGEYDLGALLVRVEHAVRKVNASRVSADSLGAFFSEYTDSTIVRGELHRVASVLKAIGVTVVMTAERSQEYGEIARYGVEEFVADNVIILRNVQEGAKRRRTMEILKFRGTPHDKGEHPFSIVSNGGIVILPRSTPLEQSASNVRVTLGNQQLDEMCGGGIFRGSVVLVSGATGTGKTLAAIEFVAGGVANGERSILFDFEESREQLFRNAIGWNIDLPQMERAGKLLVVCASPEAAGVEDHLVETRRKIEDFKPDRVAVDCLSALERVATEKGVREFAIAMTAFIKQLQITGLFTTTTAKLFGGASTAEANIFTVTDAIILLRYVEMLGAIRRGVTVMKMRGSAHDREIREFTIDDRGMHIGKPFREVSGILTGNPVRVAASEIDRVEEMFKDKHPA